ncbi:hypothetical protein JTB14_011479 [Gonioctena quinquepunctata]|nr:hypothetical protein JTB14_011479 [Gonioctena quinquepunctata]
MEITDQKILKTIKNTTTSFTKGDYVILKHEQKYFPGLIEDTKSKSYYIKAMEQIGSHWKWPHHEYVIWYDFDKVISKIEPPRPINKRGFYEVPEIKEMETNV